MNSLLVVALHAYTNNCLRIIENSVHCNWCLTFDLCLSLQPRFGICFDVDGVLARGTIPFPAAVKAFQKLVDENRDLRVPVTFVTNALNRNIDKANQIAGWVGTQVDSKKIKTDRAKIGGNYMYLE